jgi:hypothetical protein
MKGTSTTGLHVSELRKALAGLGLLSNTPGDTHVVLGLPITFVIVLKALLNAEILELGLLRKQVESLSGPELSVEEIYKQNKLDFIDGMIYEYGEILEAIDWTVQDTTCGAIDSVGVSIANTLEDANTFGEEYK